MQLLLFLSCFMWYVCWGFMVYLCYKAEKFPFFWLFKYHFVKLPNFFTLCTLINGQTLLSSSLLLFARCLLPLLMLVKLLAIFHVSAHEKVAGDAPLCSTIAIEQRPIHKCFIFQEENGNRRLPCRFSRPKTWGLSLMHRDNTMLEATQHSRQTVFIYAKSGK